MKIFTPKLPNYVKSIDEKLLYGHAMYNPYRLYSLKKNNVTQIIDLRNTGSLSKMLEKTFCKLMGIKYVNCRYPHRLSNLPEENFFQNVNDAILSNDKLTYMHCLYGKRRTGITVAYYELKNTRKTPVQVLSDLIDIGFDKLNLETKRGRKYFGILTEFIDRYLREVKL